MKRIVIMSAVLAVTMAQASPGAHGPNGEHLDTASATPSAAGLSRLPDGSVNVPMLSQRRLAIRTEIALMSEASATTELPYFSLAAERSSPK